jgi:hypothetical protein
MVDEIDHIDEDFFGRCEEVERFKGIWSTISTI